MRFEALNRLWDSVRETSHDFRASTDVFPVVDIEKLGATLDLKEKGAAAGRQNRPPPDAQSHDETEQRIVAWVEARKSWLVSRTLSQRRLRASKRNDLPRRIHQLRKDN